VGAITDAPFARRLAALRLTPQRGVLMYVCSVAALAGAYYVAGRVGLKLAYLDGAVAAVWPPAGLGLAVLFAYGVRLWPGVVVGDLLLADFSTPLGTVLAQTVGNTLAVVVGALLLRRLIGTRRDLARVFDVLALAGCACLTALVSAAFGPLALRLGGVISSDALPSVFRTWTLGDACGVLLVAPALLTWSATGVAGLRRRELVEGLVALVVLVLLAEFPAQRDVPFMVFPVLLWTALRMGPRGAATGVLVVCSITVWNTSQNDGPFVRDSITHSLLATQLFIAASALTSLLLAAVTAERTRATAALSAAEAAQRMLADEQAALRRVATLVAGDAPPSRVFEQVTAEVGRLFAVPGASVMRYDSMRTATVVGAWSHHGAPLFPVNTTLTLDGDTVLAKVLRSGSPQRVEGYEEQSGLLAETLRRFGYRAAAAAPVIVGGKLWGVLAAASTSPDALPESLEQQLCDFAELVAQALANADAFAKLAASRARLVEVGDAERRRLERNLHDGAQQQLVTVSVELGMARSQLDGNPAAAQDVLATAQEHLTQGLKDLRELARGIHPAILTEQGLGPALDALLTRAPLPVEIAELPERRLPLAAEAAAYYVVAEALTNVAKYAHASQATVSISRSNRFAKVIVSDDGIGGANPSAGSGLQGLTDRVEALNGQLDVDSSPAHGTRVTAEIPLA
jgi:signal transduction histidine kinase